MEYQNIAIEHLAQSNQLIESISKIIMEDKTAKEAFWNNSASDLLYGIIALFLEEYADGKIDKTKDKISYNEKQLIDIKTELDKPFTSLDRMKELQKRKIEIDSELDLDKQDNAMDIDEYQNNDMER